MMPICLVYAGDAATPARVAGVPSEAAQQAISVACGGRESATWVTSQPESTTCERCMRTEVFQKMMPDGPAKPKRKR